MSTSVSGSKTSRSKNVLAWFQNSKRKKGENNGSTFSAFDSASATHRNKRKGNTRLRFGSTGSVQKVKLNPTPSSTSRGTAKSSKSNLLRSKTPVHEVKNIVEASKLSRASKRSFMSFRASISRSKRTQKVVRPKFNSSDFEFEFDNDPEKMNLFIEPEVADSKKEMIDEAKDGSDRELNIRDTYATTADNEEARQTNYSLNSIPVFKLSQISIVSENVEESLEPIERKKRKGSSSVAVEEKAVEKSV